MSVEALQTINNICVISVLCLFLTVVIIQILRVIPKFDNFINNTKFGLIIFIILVSISIIIGIPAIISDIKLESLAYEEYEHLQEECLDHHSEYSKNYNFCPNCGDILDE